MFDPQISANITSAIQNTLVSIAIIIGGIWTVFTFSTLNVKKKAEAELAELQHRLSFKPLINISINANSLRNPCGNGYLITATVSIENVGSRDTTIFYPENRRPFFASKVQPMQGGNIETGDRYETGVPFGDDTKTFSRGAIVYAGACVELPFVVAVPSAGIYLLSFSSHPSVEDKPMATTAGAPEKSSPMWTGRTYVVAGVAVSDGHFSPDSPSSQNTALETDTPFS